MRRKAQIVTLVASLIALAPWGATMADEPPIRTFSAFNATIYYRYTCVNDVFTLDLGAQNQLPAGGEATLYWELWDAGAITSGEVDPVVNLNTLPVQAAGTPLDKGFPKGSVVATVPRMCGGQSLYLWAASSATRLPDGSTAVQFANAAEKPVPLPTP
jgi:hypothetical protein